VAAAVLACAACSSSAKELDTSGSREACSHFRNVAADYSAGVLTLSELRDKLIEVRDRSAAASTNVRNASTVMLAAITSGDVEGLTAAVKQMTVACQATGN
jgi:hypothetical protein